MGLSNGSKIPEVLEKYEAQLLADWIQALVANNASKGLIKETQLREECQEFLSLLKASVHNGNLSNVQSSEWRSVREMLTSVSRTRSQKGFTPSETATFVLSFKQPLFARLREELAGDANALLDDTWLATTVIDQLGLLTIEAYQKSREEVIIRQQEELMELSTPVVKLWDGILALPIIGTLDSSRTQVMMESLLQKIVETGSEVAIIDITGVPTVDTLTAQHLLKTVTAARLMGADCIISGIRPQIAQTIVYLGVDLADIITKASLADAFLLALKRLGMTINRPQAR
ncbi:anti-sigma-factor antagonist [Scytonema sp. HK-05]|uniref:STAS domain-containing protein n=1 Tax=Scytonema sp. HK-05 TaxID=1137095 RepID=UPI000936E11D|nr:STAS domain-containing protein [Scytonema sp. HK-05]OKH60021.1 anti-anti-sigma factor [Scytonema sp. HK-05]BAY42712.1 anti-sigma-factor antagonist [Scytonema sp. HK-05]